MLVGVHEFNPTTPISVPARYIDMRINHKRVLPIIWLLGATAVFAVGCDNRNQTTGSSAPNATVGETIDDSIITAKVKSGLLADPMAKGLDAKVETYNGTVQLSGFVENQSQMNRAVEIARAVVGVKDVENKMNIRTSGDE